MKGRWHLSQDLTPLKIEVGKIERNKHSFGDLTLEAQQAQLEREKQEEEQKKNTMLQRQA